MGDSLESTTGGGANGTGTSTGSSTGTWEGHAAGASPVRISVENGDSQYSLTPGQALGELTYQVDIAPQRADGYWVRAYEGTEAHCEIPDLEVDAPYNIRLRAVTENGVRGQWVVLEGVMTGKDTEPPPVPSKPRIRADLGVVVVEWDKLGAASEVMPPDFDRVEIGISRTLDGEITVTSPELSLQAPVMPIRDGSFEWPIWVRLRSVDISGNFSEWSQPEIAELKHLVDKAAIQKLIDQAAVTTSADRAPTAEDQGSQVGQIWWRRDPETGISQEAWRWDGTAWVPEDFRNAVLGRVDVSDLVADRGSVNDLVARNLAASVAQVIELRADSITANHLKMENVLAGMGEFLDINTLNITGARAKFSRAIASTLQADYAFLGTVRAGLVSTEALRVGSVQVSPECLRNMGTIFNPVSIGQFKVSESGFSVAAPSWNPSAGLMYVDAYGHISCSRLHSLDFGVSKRGRYNFAMDESGVGALTFDGTYLGRGTAIMGNQSDPAIFSSRDFHTSGWIGGGQGVWTWGQFVGGNVSESSTRKSKVNLQELRDPEALLGITPVAYQSRAEWERWAKQHPLDTEGPRYQAGVIAEDLVEAGLGIYAATGADGELIGVNYSRLTVPLLILLQRLWKRVEALETQIGAAA